MAQEGAVKRQATRPIVVRGERHEQGEEFYLPAELAELYDERGMTQPVDEEDEEPEPEPEEQEAGEEEQEAGEEEQEEQEEPEPAGDEAEEWPLAMDPATYLQHGHEKNAELAREVLRAQGREDEIPEE